MGFYRGHPLHPALSLAVEAAWSVTAGPVGGEHLVLPDGSVDLVSRDGEEAFVAGPTLKPTIAAMPPGTIVRGLRLRPGTAPTLLGVAAWELVDLDVPLRQFWGEQPGGLQEATLRRLGRREPDAVVMCAVAALSRRPSRSVGGLARELGLSERQLRRRFHDAVGYGPKRFGRVLRLQALLAEARRRPVATLAELAFASGYADQPHLHREVRALSGTSPLALLRDRGRFVQDCGVAA